MANLAFDANQVDPTDQFEALPAGDYPVIVVDSEMKTTRDNRGQYLQLTLEVIDGPYKGRKMWDRLNLDNPNQQAVEIAQRQLSQICHAVGVLQVNDSVELHDKPLVARVKVRPASGEFSESNEVSQYKPINRNAAPGAAATQPASNQGGGQQPMPGMQGQQPGAQTQQPQTTQQPTQGPAAGSVPPWQR